LAFGCRVESNNCLESDSYVITSASLFTEFHLDWTVQTPTGSGFYTAHDPHILSESATLVVVVVVVVLLLLILVP
jgi:hypothetical protein